MKRIIAAILVLVFALAMSGCVKITYWDGMTKQEAKDYICKELEEKYGEEFVVEKMYTTGATYYSSADLWAECSPKSDSDILFSVQSIVVGKSRIMREDYIRNVVRKQIKKKVDEGLSGCYDNFAVEVNVMGLDYWYDSGIRSADEATIKKFSESFKNKSENQINKTSVWIVFNNNSFDMQKLGNTLKKLSLNFHNLYVEIDCFFANQETIDLCNKKANDKTTDHWAVQEITYDSDFRWEKFIYYNDNRGLIYIGNNID